MNGYGWGDSDEWVLRLSTIQVPMSNDRFWPILDDFPRHVGTFRSRRKLTHLRRFTHCISLIAERIFSSSLWSRLTIFRACIFSSLVLTRSGQGFISVCCRSKQRRARYCPKLAEVSNVWVGIQLLLDSVQGLTNPDSVSMNGTESPFT